MWQSSGRPAAHEIVLLRGLLEAVTLDRPRSKTGPTMTTSIPQLLLAVGLALAFIHFLYAAMRTFVLPDAMDGASQLSQLSFMSGAAVALMNATAVRVVPGNAIAAGVLMLVAVALYEWARGTIRGRRFHIIYSDRVPEALCTDGPYRYVRHPLYASYITAFVAVFVLRPTVLAAVVLVLNLVFFTYGAVRDERALQSGPFAADYAAYKARVGRFFPRLLRKGSPRD
jgi:protein-S-isoprenylcysteine O-methyltransferase Ste14